AAAALQKTLEGKRWGETEKKLADFRERYAAEFPQARDDSAQAQIKLEKQWMDAEEETQQISALLLQPDSALSPAALQTARDTLAKHSGAWQGSAHGEELANASKQLEARAKGIESGRAEAEAEKTVKLAEDYINRKAYAVAISILKVKIVNDPQLK